jgi:hypothetical protein
MVGHRKNYAPESAIPSILGIAAAREPLVRNGPNMECDVQDFWGGVAFNFPKLKPEAQHEIGLKRLKRLWLETAWAHIADRQGRTRRAVAFFERYYWDAGKIDPALVALYQDVRPARPFGPAIYYSVAIERACERQGKAYLGDGGWNRPITDLREAGVALNYYVSDAALAKIGPDSRPTFWIVPRQPGVAGDLLPAGERARIEAIAPVLDEKTALRAATPLRFSGGNRGLTGFGFIDQNNRLIIVVSDRIERGEDNNHLPATRAEVAVSLPDGAYTAHELLGDTRISFTVAKGRGIFRTALPRWDTKVFAIPLARISS